MNCLRCGSDYIVRNRISLSRRGVAPPLGIILSGIAEQ